MKKKLVNFGLFVRKLLAIIQQYDSNGNLRGDMRGGSVNACCLLTICHTILCDLRPLSHTSDVHSIQVNVSHPDAVILYASFILMFKSINNEIMGSTEAHSPNLWGKERKIKNTQTHTLTVKQVKLRTVKYTSTAKKNS